MVEKRTVISLGRMLTNAEVTERTKEGLRMRRETGNGGSSKASTTESSKSSSELGTKSSIPRNTGIHMSLNREIKRESDRRESTNKTEGSGNSTSISWGWSAKRKPNNSTSKSAYPGRKRSKSAELKRNKEGKLISRLRESTRKRERLDTMRRFASGKSRPNREESSQRESESHKKSRASREKSTERRGSKRRDREELRSSNKGKRRSKGNDLSSKSR